jgi:antibiotic biosynthesis monooxygenase (ABM) superfamily enzyme
MSATGPISGLNVPDRLPVITIVELKPKAPMEGDALGSIFHIINSASRFEGYQAADIYQKVMTGAPTEYAIILRFDTYDHLREWNNSPVRAQHIALSKHFFDQVKPELSLTGLDFWFDNKQKGTATPPPKWKMLLVTVVIIFVMLNAVMPLIGRLLSYSGLPVVFNTLIGVVIMVSMMTYVIMPGVTGLLHRWLFTTKHNQSKN